MYTSKKKQVIKKRKQKQTRKQTQTKSRKQIGKGLSKKEKKEKKKKEKEEKEKKKKEEQLKEEKKKEEKKKNLKELMNKEHWHSIFIILYGVAGINLMRKLNDKLLYFINKLSKLNLTIENRKVKVISSTDYSYTVLFYTTENIIDKEKLDDFGYITINPYN